MRLKPKYRHTKAETFDFVLFKSGPFLLGALAEQVSALNHHMSHPQENIEIIALRDVFPFPDPTEKGLQPVFLKICGKSPTRYMSADTAVGVITLQKEDIRKLPPLIELQKHQTALWGLALIGEEIAFLLDLDRIEPAHIRTRPSSTGKRSAGSHRRVCETNGKREKRA
jgi:hypothetical protein